MLRHKKRSATKEHIGRASCTRYHCEVSPILFDDNVPAHSMTLAYDENNDDAADPQCLRNVTLLSTAFLKVGVP